MHGLVGAPFVVGMGRSPQTQTLPSKPVVA